MDQDKVTSSISDSPESNIDILTRKVDILQITIDKLISMMEERQEVLDKGKDAMNNIHRVFGSQGMGMGGLLTAIMKSDDSDSEDPYGDSTQTPSLKFRDCDDEDGDDIFRREDNPFN